MAGTLSASTSPREAYVTSAGRRQRGRLHPALLARERRGTAPPLSRGESDPSPDGVVGSGELSVRRRRGRACRRVVSTPSPGAEAGAVQRSCPRRRSARSSAGSAPPWPGPGVVHESPRLLAQAHDLVVHFREGQAQLVRLVGVEELAVELVRIVIGRGGIV